MFETKLKQAGFKLTAPRRAVIKLLEKRHAPITAQEVHAKLKEIDLVSVYRTLALFEEIGIAFKEEAGGKARYFLADHQHHHITCSKCGRVECVPCEHHFSKIKNFTEINHQLTLTGLCVGCSK